MEGETSDDSKILWDITTTRTLISVRLKYENDFRKGKAKKYPLWEVILEEMRKENPNVSEKLTISEMMRKFNNLMHSYKRIRDRGQQAGNKIATTWEYYEDFNTVYSDLYSPTVSPETVQSKANNYAVVDTSEEASMENENNDDNDEEYIPDSKPIIRKRLRSDEASSLRSSVMQKRKKMKYIGSNTLNGEILTNSLKEYDASCEKRHRQNLKVGIKRVKIEQENMKILTEMRDILKEFRF